MLTIEWQQISPSSDKYIAYWIKSLNMNKMSCVNYKKMTRVCISGGSGSQDVEMKDESEPMSSLVVPTLLPLNPQDVRTH